MKFLLWKKGLKLFPLPGRKKRRPRRSGGERHAIIVSVTRRDGGLLARALGNIQQEHVAGLRVHVVARRRDAPWVKPLVHHFSGNLPCDVVLAPNEVSRAGLFRHGLEAVDADSHVAFMRASDRWLAHGIWRLISLNIGKNADIMAGATACSHNGKAINSYLASLIRDRSYELSVAQLPALVFDGQIFGKFFRRDVARTLFTDNIDLDRGGYAYSSLQSAYLGAKISICNNVVYSFSGSEQFNFNFELPYRDHTFSLRHMLKIWTNDQELMDSYVWPRLLSPEFYFPVPDNKEGQRWMTSFLSGQFTGIDIPEQHLRQRSGDKPYDLFARCIAEGDYTEAYNMMKRCRFRASRTAEELPNMKQARKRSTWDLAGIQQRVHVHRHSLLMKALKTNGRLGARSYRKKGKPFRNFIIDRVEGFGTHRSGWASIMQHLAERAKPGKNPVYVDSFLEKTYCWDADISVPHREVPWVGFAHRPPNIPDWYPEDLRRQFYHHPDFLRSLDTCLGIFALSEYHAAHLRSILPVPVDVLYHPAERVKQTWDADLLDERPKVVQVGFWLRNMHGIYFLPPGNYEKVLLNKGSKEGAAAKAFAREAEILRRQGHDLDSLYTTASELDFLPADEYDLLLSSCVVFLDMYDASANNTVVECMVRKTPLLVRRLPPVEEYLGKDYPLFFETYEEAAEKLNNMENIIAAHEHLKDARVQRRVSMSLFANNFLRSPLLRMEDQA